MLRATEPAIGLILLRFALAVWLGGGLCVLLGTRSIFQVAQTRALGGLFSGAVLASFSRLRWAAVALTVVGWLLLGTTPALWAATAAVLTIVQAPLDANIRALRARLGGSTEALASDDPLRKRWGALHGASVLLLLGQIACAAAGLVATG